MIYLEVVILPQFGKVVKSETIVISDHGRPPATREIKHAIIDYNVNDQLGYITCSW